MLPDDLSALRAELARTRAESRLKDLLDELADLVPPEGLRVQTGRRGLFAALAIGTEDQPLSLMHGAEKEGDLARRERVVLEWCRGNLRPGSYPTGDQIAERMQGGGCNYATSTIKAALTELRKRKFLVRGDGGDGYGLPSQAA